MKIRSEYEKKWVKLMLSSKDSDKEAAECAVNRFHELCNQSPPSIFIWMSSPAEIDLVCYIFHRCDDLTFSILQKCRANNLEASSESIWEEVWEKLGPRLPGRYQPLRVKKVWQTIWRQISGQVDRDNRWDQIDQVIDDLNYPDGVNIWDRFGNTMDQKRDSSSLNNMPKRNIWPEPDRNEVRKIEHIRGEIANELSMGAKAEGNRYSRPPLVATRHRFYFYDWYNSILKLKYDEHLKLVMEIADNCYNWITVKNACIMIENPLRVKCNAEGRLHSDGNMAIEFNDGFGLWRLNGVRVPKEIVTTPREKLSSKVMLAEKNAEVRREIVRKLGIEKICKDLKARCIDRWENYELLLLNLGDSRRRPYLKMLNPSIGTYHIEGVQPFCKTVKAALAWRNGLKEYKTPEILT